MVIPAGSLGFKDLEEEYEEDEEGDESSLDDDMMEGRDELQFATPAAEPLTKGPVMDGGRDFDLPGEEWKEGWEDMGGSKGLLGEDSSDQWRVAAAQTRIAPETAQTASEEKEGEPPRSPGRAAHARSPAPNSGAAQGAASLRKESMESVESDGSYAVRQRMCPRRALLSAHPPGVRALPYPAPQSDPGTFGSATGLGTAGRGSGGRARGVLGGSPSYPRKAVQGGRAAAAPTLDGGLRHSLLEAGEQGERWRPRTGASLSHRRRRARRRLWHPQEFEAEFGEGPLGLSLRPVLVRGACCRRLLGDRVRAGQWAALVHPSRSALPPFAQSTTWTPTRCPGARAVRPRRARGRARWDGARHCGTRRRRRRMTTS